jgi:hypothetical protein
MPRYTVLIPADHTGTARRIELQAATPWQALETSQSRYGWLSAELSYGTRSLCRVDHVPADRHGVWHIAPAET